MGLGVLQSPYVTTSIGHEGATQPKPEIRA